jgi:hypothetical protein
MLGLYDSVLAMASLCSMAAIAGITMSGSRTVCPGRGSAIDAVGWATNERKSTGLACSPPGIASCWAAGNTVVPADPQEAG